MNKQAYQAGVQHALSEAFSKQARAPEDMSIEDLQALRDDYFGSMNEEYNPTLAQQREAVRQHAGTAGSLAGMAVGETLGDEDSPWGPVIGSMGGRLVGEYLGGRGADKMVEEETPWQRMSPAQQKQLVGRYLEKFRRYEIPAPREQRRDAMVGGGLLGGLGGTALGAGLGLLAGRPGLGALIGAPVGVGAGVGLGALRGIRKYPTLEQIGRGDFEDA